MSCLFSTRELPDEQPARTNRAYSSCRPELRDSLSMDIPLLAQERHRICSRPAERVPDSKRHDGHGASRKRPVPARDDGTARAALPIWRIELRGQAE